MRHSSELGNSAPSIRLGQGNARDDPCWASISGCGCRFQDRSSEEGRRAFSLAATLILSKLPRDLDSLTQIQFRVQLRHLPRVLAENGAGRVQPILAANLGRLRVAKLVRMPVLQAMRRAGDTDRVSQAWAFNDSGPNCLAGVWP